LNKEGRRKKEDSREVEQLKRNGRGRKMVESWKVERRKVGHQTLPDFRNVFLD